MLEARLRPSSGQIKPAVAMRPLDKSERLGIVIEPVARAGSEIDHLWRLVGPAYENCVVRDAAWVQWRYLDEPASLFSVLMARKQGRPAGYIAYRLANAGGRLIGRVADLFVRPGDADVAGALLRAALTHLRGYGADSVAVLLAAGSDLHARLRANGFLLPRGHYRASFIPYSSTVDFDSLSDPARWLLVGGDFDVV
jgi:hypothetical protein